MIWEGCYIWTSFLSIHKWLSGDWELERMETAGELEKAWILELDSYKGNFQHLLAL